MIRNKVSEMIGQKRLTIGETARLAGVSYTAVDRLYRGTAKRVDLETLDKLCIALECDLTDLFEFVPDEPPSIE